MRGARWGSGAHHLLFLHEPGANIDAWGSLPRALARALPVAAIAIDLPGHGLSDDPWEPDRLSEVIRLFAPHSGERHHIIIAAGASALAALDLADALDLAGLVGFSPPRPDPDWTPRRSPRTPKLFFAGSCAGEELEIARRLASSCGGWSAVTSIPVCARGAALLETDWRGRIVEHVMGFARDCLYPRPVGANATRFGQ